MCFKDDEQTKDLKKFNELIKDIPDFAQNYFLFLNSGKSKLTSWCLIRQFLEWLIEYKVINNTIENITPDDLSKVKDTDVVRYFDGLLNGLYCKKPVSYGTINTKKNYISGFWSNLVENDYVPKNIITKNVTSKYKVEDINEIEVPTDEQLQNLINNIGNMKNELDAIRNIAIIKLFSGTGIRLSELVGLDVDDLHFENENPEITIWAKGKKKSRNVLVSKSAIDAVNDYLKVRNSYPELTTLIPLFLSEKKDSTGKNGRLGTKAIYDFIDKYSNKEIHPHMLRHYVGTKMYENSNDIAGVCDQLGHGDIKVTKKYYVKANKSANSAALNSF